ncbi:hypothetical protein H2198_003772 [Neophaeococcomyces mojaviensis]|uniref:Uncharacterized protein n=1 Tax=Neophaeococcomyces mojaviensis TaxID=3383035 RepID=A0ACC3AAG3_9EURO|nr:hypothetical protein H2198_003772 [Knufia sp. JES_112]
MSNQQSSYTSYSSTSYTSFSSTNNGQPHTQSYSENASYNSRDGGHVERISQETGQPTLSERRDIPVQGRVGTRNAAGNRIEDVTDKDSEQAKRDKEYEERIEEEYAKREGGA